MTTLCNCKLVSTKSTANFAPFGWKKKSSDSVNSCLFTFPVFQQLSGISAGIVKGAVRI